LSYKIKSSKKWALKNPEKVKIIKIKNKIKHHDKYLEASKIYYKNKRKDPLFKMSRNISKAIWNWIKENKNYKHWEDLVGYTKEELFKHLENQFDQSMTWENYGTKWHIDHIKPLSWFSYETQFKEAWDLNNLQPMIAEENLSKGNRYEGKYRNIK